MTTSAGSRDELIALAREADIRFNVTPEAEQRIAALAEVVAAANPRPTVAVDGLDALAGRWRLLYSGFRLERRATLRRLSFAKLPDVEVTITGIFQEITADGANYNNVVEFEHEGLRGAQETRGRFEPEAPNRLNIRFEETSVYAIEPAVDESALRERLGVAADARLRAPVSFEGWSDVTYLDDELRVMRGNLGNLYVIVRDDAAPVSLR